jgi:hypothetical protein
MELEALQETAADIKARGASLVVVSPQLEKYSKLMVKKNNLTFPLLRDEDNQLASQFGLAFNFFAGPHQRRGQQGAQGRRRSFIGRHTGFGQIVANILHRVIIDIIDKRGGDFAQGDAGIAIAQRLIQLCQIGAVCVEGVTGPQHGLGHSLALNGICHYVSPGLNLYKEWRLGRMIEQFDQFVIEPEKG